MPNEFTLEWYEQTLRAVLGAFQRINQPPAVDTGARMLYMIREQGKSIAEAQDWLSSQGQGVPSRRSDAIDLHTVTVHASPPDIADWPSTVTIVGLEMFPKAHPRNGLNFSFDAIPSSWDFHMPGWGSPGDPGNLLYTVWAIARAGNQWHAGAFIQMWRGRANTGAPILAEWSDNWVERRARRMWGSEMADYVPGPGDHMGFFVSAGNARLERGPTSVRERSNVVMVALPAGDSGQFRFSD